MTLPIHETLMLLGATMWHDNYIIESPLLLRGTPVHLTIVERREEMRPKGKWTLHVSIAAPVTLMHKGVILSDVTAVLYYANQFKRIETQDRLDHFINMLEQDDGYPETSERLA